MTPDARRALLGSDNNTLRVLDLESGACLCVLEGHRDRVRHVSVTPDGRLAVSGSWDKTVRVWDVESGVCLGIFVAAAPILAIVISWGLVTIGTLTGEVQLVDMRNLPAGPATLPITAPATSDAVHEASLRRGLEHSRSKKGPDHEETLAHVEALALHLARMGKTDEAQLLRLEVQEHEMREEPEERKRLAVSAYLCGNYAHAERLCRSLIANGFEVPGMICYLSRMLLVQDRIEEAVTETCAAWEHCAEAPSFVIPRILWLQLAVLYAWPSREAGIINEHVILGRLKTALADEGSHKEWTMDPVLEHLQPKLSAKKYHLLATLVAVINDSAKLPNLERFPSWRNVQAIPLT